MRAQRHSLVRKCFALRAFFFFSSHPFLVSLSTKAGVPFFFFSNLVKREGEKLLNDRPMQAKVWLLTTV